MSSGPERPAYDHRAEPVHTGDGFEPPLQPWELRRTADLPPESRPRIRHRDADVRRTVADPALIETK